MRGGVFSAGRASARCVVSHRRPATSNSRCSACRKSASAKRSPFRKRCSLFDTCGALRRAASPLATFLFKAWLSSSPCLRRPRALVVSVQECANFRDVRGSDGSKDNGCPCVRQTVIRTTSLALRCLGVACLGWHFLSRSSTGRISRTRLTATCARTVTAGKFRSSSGSIAIESAPSKLEFACAHCHLSYPRYE